MTINFTLIIQFVHFFIAYLIISKIFLKPAIAVIQEEEKRENQLLSFAESEKLAIKEKEAYKDLLWRKSHKQFDAGKPDLEEAAKLFVSWKTPKSLSISKEEITKTKSSLVDFVVNKVKHVQ